jgi:hypothetical protein
MKRNWVRKIIGGLSFTSALFIFQACYGSMQDMTNDVLIEGQVKSKTLGLPVKGIKVSVPENMQYDITDENGKFSLYTIFLDTMKIGFEDIDPMQDGGYLKKDTVLINIKDSVFLNIIMEEK